MRWPRFRSLRDPRNRTLLWLSGACFVLSAVGNHLGLLPSWNPDDLGPKAHTMLDHKSLFPAHYYYPTFHYYVLMAFQAVVFLPIRLLGGAEAGVSFGLPACLLISRFVSALMAAGTVWVLGVGLRDLLPDRARTTAAFLCAFAYGIVGLAHWSTADVPALFFVTAATVAAVRYAHAPSRRRLMWIGVLVGLTASTKYNGGLVLLPALAAYVRVRLAGDVAEEERRTGRIIGLVLLAVGTALVVWGFGLRGESGAHLVSGFARTGDDPDTVRRMAGALAKIILLLGGVFGALGVVGALGRRGAGRLGRAVRDGDLWRLLGLALGVFLLASPTILLRPAAFLRDFLWVSTTATFYKTQVEGGLSLVQNARLLLESVGLPALLLGIVGLPLLFRRTAGPLRLFLLFSIPYFLVISTWSRFNMRWVLPCIPTLAVAAGLAFEAGAERLGGGRLRIARVVVGLGAALVALRGVAATAEFFRDPRIREAAEFVRTLEPGTQLATFRGERALPPIPDGVTVERFRLNQFPGTPDVIRAEIQRFRASKAEYLVLTGWNESFQSAEAFPLRTPFFRSMDKVFPGFIRIRSIGVRPLVSYLPAGGEAPEFLHPTYRFYRRE